MAALPGKQKKVRGAGRQGGSWVWYFFLLPTILGIVLFMLYPVLESFRLSFFKSNGTIESFNGIKNYVYILGNSDFRKALFNTFFINFFQLLVTIPLSFVIAVAINSLQRGKNLLKALFFIPYVTPAIAAGTLFLFILHPEGILNAVIGFFGFDSIAWLSNGWAARAGAVILGIWRSLGFNIIIYLAYLQAISPEYYEAAYIDGCNRFQSHLYITLPQMKGATAFLLIMGWINGLQRFTDIYVLGGQHGSPAHALYTIVSFIYERGFGNYEFGIASAASWVLFAIIMVFTYINMKLTKMDL